ncbi:FYN-binding protein 1 isoform X1 [Gadus morhua]|uniref:FYN binding protein 1 b n=1 Tax=Gadus morhua TaxID=8049 RepID=A0A8C5AKN2_GADMO|nr:FYN-binding protein 1-like isoform X1 [Gadus morhua]
MESDVKAIRARFQAAQTASPQTDSTGSPSHPGRLKTPLHPTLSSSSTSSPTPPFLLPKKPSFDGSSFPSKPAFPKPSSTSSCKGAPRGGQETAKALAGRFSVPQEEHSGSGSSGKPFPRGHPEPTLPKPKLPVLKPPVSAPLTESRPAFHKPPPVMPTTVKPSWARDGGGGGGGAGGTASNHGGLMSKAPPAQQKPSSAVTKTWLHGEDAKAESDNKHINASINASASRLPMGFTIAPISASGAMAMEKTKPNPPNPPKAADAWNSTPPPKPLVNKKPGSFIRRNLDSRPAPQQKGGDPDGAPRRNPLPNPLLLGPPPAKPSRPPRVNLDRFRGQAKGPDQGPVIVPPPPASHPSNQSNGGGTPPLSAQPMAPSLPPRHPGISEPDPEEYDDVGLIKTAPPPPPSTEGRPRLVSKPQDDESDGETYEELDERWEAAEQESKEKQKEEKKRLEAEKKEQKEREKKENEARKKFKLVGPLEKMHQVKVLVECKGSKTDLALKKGDCVDIIRVQDNPEGKWLGRLANGSIGYLKNDCVEVDLQSWKQQQQGPQSPQEIDDQEVYDDVDVSNNHPDSGIRGSRVILPPPPDDTEEIYDDAIDASLDVSVLEAPKSSPKTLLLRMFEKKKPAAGANEVPAPSQFTAKGQPGALIDDEIYDDIDSQVVPPPLPVSSHPPTKTKMEEIDPKRQKKLEKEEKEFRKKFKYEGEIQVLYQVTIIPTLTLKKLSGKDLPVKPGETLDVIVKAVDNKLVCRNEEGKFGTVLTSHIVTDDGDIYDDIGDECIYDND